MSKTYGIILAGGQGKRMQKNIPKQFLFLAQKPILAYSLETFNSLKEIDYLLITSPRKNIPEVEKIVNQYKIYKVAKIIPGGKTRQESVWQVLSSCSFEKNDILIIHDAVRPLATKGLIKKCLTQVKKGFSAGVYVPVKDSLAEIKENSISKNIARENIYQAQTPQAFLYQVIKDAHLKYLNNKKSFSDDVSLVLEAGYQVKKIDGFYKNIKITFPEDLILGETFLKEIKN